MFLRTTEKLTEYVRIHYDKDMVNLVKHRTERVFTDPPLPSKKLRDADEIHIVRYKEQMAQYYREKKTYDTQKTQVFGIILGQCSKIVKDCLENHTKFREVEMTCDVIGLVELLEEMSHSTMDTQEPYWALVNVQKKLLGLHQHRNEPVANYYVQFKSVANVLQAQWGMFYPPRMVESDSAEEIQKANAATLAAIFMANADQSKYRSLKDRLNNDFLAGKDNYPKTLDQAVNLLTYNQDHQSRGGLSSLSVRNEQGERATSFAQTGKGKQKKAARSTRSQEDSDDDDSSTSSSRKKTTSRSQGWNSN